MYKTVKYDLDLICLGKVSVNCLINKQHKRKHSHKVKCDGGKFYIYENKYNIR